MLVAEGPRLFKMIRFKNKLVHQDACLILAQQQRGHPRVKPSKITAIPVGDSAAFIDYVADVAAGAEDWLDPEVQGSGPAAMADYLARGAAPSSWAGAGADAAGLKGPVELRWIKELAEGRDPITGEQLGRGTATAGCEMSLSPPKSISAYAAVLAIAGDDTAGRVIDEALDEAAARAVEVAEQLGAGRARSHVGSGPQRHMVWYRTSGLIASIYAHETNYNGDPQKHRHLFFLNRTQRADGQWRGIDTRALYTAKATMTAEARAIFNQRIVERLGVNLDENGEIASTPAELVKRWSSRDEEITTAVQEWRDSLDKPISDNEAKAAAQRIAGATRKGGGPGPETRAERLERWRTEVVELLGPQVRLEEPPGAAEAQAYRLAAWAWPPSPADGLTAAVEEARTALNDRLKERGMWQRRQVWAEAAKLVSPGADARWAEWLRDDVLAAAVDITRRGPQYEPSGLYDHDDPNGGRWQAVEVWQAEHAIDQAVRLGRDAGRAVAAPQPLWDEGLDAAQREAVDAICDSGDEISLVVGPAGSGKTTMMRAAAARWAAAGYRVTGLATAAKAAAVLKVEAQLNDAHTVAKLLHSPEVLPRGSVLLLDEAGMTNTLDMAAVIRAVEATASKLVLVGDPEQLAGIGAAGMFRHLVATGAAARLGRSRRHVEDWENANSDRLRDGHHDGIDTLAEHGRIVAAGDFASAAAQVRARYRAALDAGETFAATAATKAEVWALNLELRHELELGAELGQLHRSDLDVHTPIATGDIIATGRNTPYVRDDSGETIKNGERWRVLGRIDTPPGEPAGLRVESLERPGAVAELPGDYVVGANDDGRPWIEHAIATTVHRTQGATVDRAVALVTGRTDRPGVYVPSSRGRLSNHLIAVGAGDDTEALEAVKAALNRLPADMAGITYTGAETAVAAALPHHAELQASAAAHTATDWAPASIEDIEAFDPDDYLPSPQPTAPSTATDPPREAPQAPTPAPAPLQEPPQPHEGPAPPPEPALEPLQGAEAPQPPLTIEELTAAGRRMLAAAGENLRSCIDEANAIIDWIIDRIDRLLRGGEEPEPGRDLEEAFEVLGYQISLFESAVDAHDDSRRRLEALHQPAGATVEDLADAQLHIAALEAEAHRHRLVASKAVGAAAAAIPQAVAAGQDPHLADLEAEIEQIAGRFAGLGVQMDAFDIGAAAPTPQTMHQLYEWAERDHGIDPEWLVRRLRALPGEPLSAGAAWRALLAIERPDVELPATARRRPPPETELPDAGIYLDL